jgi:mannose-6-phosphate isomerase-like protein (cupin superfamily)
MVVTLLSMVYKMVRMTQDIAGFVVEAGQSRSGEPLRLLGETIFVKVSGDDTTGAFEVAEEITPPQGGPPLHLHKREDEWLYVVEGKFLFEMDGRRLEASAGNSVFVPRGVPHTFQNIGDSPGRLLGLVAPAGIERFFRALAEICVDGPPALAALSPLFENYGLELLGPPLGAR